MSRMWEIDPETRTKVRASVVVFSRPLGAVGQLTQTRHTAPPYLQDEWE